MANPATLTIAVYVKPNAKQTKLIGQDDRGLIIALHAKPQDGAANAELIAFLAKLSGVPKSRIILRRGETARYKILEMPWNAVMAEMLNNHSRGDA